MPTLTLKNTLANKLKNAKKIAPKKKLEKGYVLFEGKSNINGANIVGIITTKTSNKKTGQMAQLWILNADLKPTDASKEGKDDAVCGDCKLRKFLGGACYVNLGQAPNIVYKTYKNGGYSNLSIQDYSILNGLAIRFGAYGDPYALPIEILTKLKSVAKNNTSYTHQWETENNEVLKSLSMASVDSIEEQKKAVKSGWRTFRVANEDSIILEDEIICPNVTVGVSCLDCGLCSDTSSKAKNIVIPVHGSLKNRFKD